MPVTLVRQQKTDTLDVLMSGDGDNSAIRSRNRNKYS